MLDLNNTIIPKEEKDRLLKFVVNPQKHISSIKEFNNNIVTLNGLSTMMGYSKAKDVSIWDYLDDEGCESNDVDILLPKLIKKSNKYARDNDIKKSNLMFLYAVVIKHNDNIYEDAYDIDFE